MRLEGVRILYAFVVSLVYWLIFVVKSDAIYDVGFYIENFDSYFKDELFVFDRYDLYDLFIWKIFVNFFHEILNFSDERLFSLITFVNTFIFYVKFRPQSDILYFLFPFTYASQELFIYAPRFGLVAIGMVWSWKYIKYLIPFLHLSMSLYVLKNMPKWILILVVFSTVSFALTFGVLERYEYILIGGGDFSYAYTIMSLGCLVLIGSDRSIFLDKSMHFICLVYSCIFVVSCVAGFQYVRFSTIVIMMAFIADINLKSQNGLLLSLMLLAASISYAVMFLS